MKRLLLAASLFFSFSLSADKVSDFLSTGFITSAEQKEKLGSLLLLLQELSVDDRTVVSIFLEALEDDEDCSECSHLLKLVLSE